MTHTDVSGIQLVFSSRKKSKNIFLPGFRTTAVGNFYLFLFLGRVVESIDNFVHLLKLK